MNAKLLIPFLAAVSSGAIMSTRAANVTFPSASGDLASDTDWGEVSHGSADDWVLASNNGVYEISANISPYTLSWTKPAVIDCTKAAVTPVISFQIGAGESQSRALFPGGTRDTDNSWASNCGQLEIRGGIWDFNHIGRLQSVKGYNRAVGSTLLLTDGAVMTNVVSVQVSNNGAVNSMLVRGGSAVYADNANVRLRDNACSASLFEVSGGSKFCYNLQGNPANGGNLTFDNSGHDNTNLFTGVGTVFSNCCNAAALFTGNGDILHVTDGAKFYLAGGIYLCDRIKIGDDYYANSNNLLRVENGAEFSGGVVYFNRRQSDLGSHSLAFNNRIEVLNGGVFRPSSITIDGCGCEILVSNATYRAGLSYIGGSNNVMRFTGTANTFIRPSGGVFDYADNMGHAHNRLVFDGVPMVWPQDSLYLGSTGSISNGIEIVNGGSLTITNSMRFSNYSGVTDARFTGNRLYIGSGSSLTTAHILIDGRANMIVISNGTMNVTADSNIGMMLGDGSVEDLGCHTLVLEGAEPRYVGNGATFYTRKNSRVVFNVPPTGFTGTGAIITSGAFSDDGTTTLEINGLEALKANLAQTTVYELLAATNEKARPAFSEGELAALNETLPDGCSVYVSGAKLLLKVKVQQPMMMILK